MQHHEKPEIAKPDQLRQIFEKLDLSAIET